MKRTRKLVSVMTAAAMSVSMAAGLGTATAFAEDPYEIVMTFPTVGVVPQDLEVVEEAVSSYSLEKLGCTVKLKPISLMEMGSQYSLWAATGEPVDLLLMYQMDMGSYIGDESVICLDEYMDDCENIKKAAETSLFLSGGLYDGKQYAIPYIERASGAGKAFVVRKDLMDEIEYEQKDFYTYEDFDDIMSKIKANHPDMIMIGRTGKQMATNATYFLDCDALGVQSCTNGVLMGRDSTEIVNLFETEEYKEYLTWQKKWYDAGYISSDAATTSDTVVDWVRSGRCAGFVPGSDAPGSLEGSAAGLGYELVALNVIPSTVTTSSYNTFRWAVSANSENPEKAMEFLDLMYAEDGELANLLTYGIEGVHYGKTEGQNMIIHYPEGIDPSTAAYASFGVFGDRRNVYDMDPNTDEIFEVSAEYTAKAEENKSVALGYVFNSDEYANEISAITSVLSQYLDTLEYGMVSDVDAAHSEFVGALKDAGIDDVIAGNQAQFDEWLAQQK